MSNTTAEHDRDAGDASKSECSYVRSGQWLSLTDAAAVLGRSSKTLERWIKLDRIKSRKVGERCQVFVGLWAGDPRSTQQPVGIELPPDDAAVDQVDEVFAENPAEQVAHKILQVTEPTLSMAQDLADLADARTADANRMARRAQRIATVGWIAAGSLVLVLLVWAMYFSVQITEARTAERSAVQTRGELAIKLEQAIDKLNDQESDRIWLVQDLARARAAVLQLRQSQKSQSRSDHSSTQIRKEG